MAATLSKIGKDSAGIFLENIEQILVPRLLNALKQRPIQKERGVRNAYEGRSHEVRSLLRQRRFGDKASKKFNG